MRNKLKKLKISKMLVAFGSCAMIFELLIGTVAYFGVTNLNTGYKTIVSYND